MPRIVPMISGNTVSSGSRTEAGMNGRNDAARGLVGRAPTTSGYSLGGLTCSTLAITKDLSDKHAKVQVYCVQAAGAGDWEHPPRACLCACRHRLVSQPN